MVLSDYYGFPIANGDIVKMQPWSLNGFPESFVNAMLIVAGRDESGMLVVVDPKQGEATLVWPETVFVAERDGEQVAPDAISWWASIVGQTGMTSEPIELFGWNQTLNSSTDQLSFE